MVLRSLLALGPFAVAFAILNGCSGGGTGGTGGSSITDANTTACEDLCAKVNKCAGATQADCSTSCASSQVPGGTTCASEYSTFLSCANGVPDVCSQTPSSACDTQDSALQSCIATYCASNPNGQGCSSSSDTDGG
jgi:hypothetical protein